MSSSRCLRTSRGAAVALVISGLALAGCSPPPAAGPGALATVHSQKLTALCVTEGEVEPKGSGKMEVADPAMRAVALGTGGDAADLEFTYEGPTATETPLANGELRRQIGLKLRAADSCNVVYVMWRLEPSSGLAVSVKRNPGMSESKQCHDGGYHSVTPAHVESVPSIHVGETHSLRAELSGKTLRVFADGRLAWEGEVSEETLAFDGPVGIRTDNGRFVFRVVGEPRGGPNDCPRGELVASG